MKKIILSVLLLSVFLVGMAAAAPLDVTLFEDDFESDMNQWTPSSPTSDVYLSDTLTSGDYYLVVRDDKSAVASIDTTGYKNIEFSYDRRTATTFWSDPDQLEVYWRVGDSGGWTFLEAMYDNSWNVVSWSLLGAEDESEIQIRFFLNDGNNDYGVIDDVLIVGDEIDDDAPVITMDNDPTYPTCSSDITVCATVIDASAIDFVNISCTAGSTTITHSDVVAFGDQYCSAFSAGSMGPSDGMDFVCTVNAEDVHGNPAQSGPTTLATYDCEAPNVTFTCTPTSGNEFLTVDCTSTSTDVVTPTNELVYAWTFGNGDTSTLANPSITYTEDGLYDVSLTVTDNALNSDVLTKVEYIEVFDTLPATSFTANPNPVDEGLDVVFTDTTVPTDPIGSWSWNFGDSESSTEQNPTHAYADNGVYTVSLTVCEATETNDCTTKAINVTVNNVNPDVDAGAYLCDEAETITLTASATDVAADTLAYAWDLNGNGSYTDAFGEVVSYTCGNGDDILTDVVSVKVIDDDGGWNTDDADITIANVAPIANANGDYTGVVNVGVELNGSAIDPIETSFTYEWDCDYDGITFASDETGQNPNCEYSEKGVYTVAVIANDGEDSGEIATATVNVYDYSIGLDAGWNLISFPLIAEDDDTDYKTVLGNVKEDLEKIWTYKYDPATGKNKWYYKTGGSSSWSGMTGFNDIVPGYGYYVFMTNERTLFQNGEKMYGENLGAMTTPPVVQLDAGWNLIGHYGMNTDVVKAEALEAFSGVASTVLNENGAIVNAFNPTEGYWMFSTEINTGEYAPSIADYN